MKLQTSLILPFVAAGLSTPIMFRDEPPPANATFFPCTEATTDPICIAIRQPILDVISEITYENGTVETVTNLYTRDELEKIRLDNNVTSVEHIPGQPATDLEKREGAPPICRTETQRWFDQKNWGYWYQDWHQVGNCFYCDNCSEAIATSFGVSQTWTYGLSVNFNQVISATFSFAWGETFTLTDTRTCIWNNVEHGCHSIWYQPLMSYHNGEANYQTHSHCSAGSGIPAHDSYYNHQYTSVNVNQAGNSHGVNQGNLGCGSGCGGKDHRQCEHGNNGGSLWPYPN